MEILTITGKWGNKDMVKIRQCEMKKFFRRAAYSTAFFVLIVVLVGCTKKGKAASGEKPDEIWALEEKIRVLNAELESVRKELHSERETSLELAQLLSRSRQGGAGESVRPVEVSDLKGDGKVGGESDSHLTHIEELSRELARLRMENNRLAWELQTLQAARSGGSGVFPSEQNRTAAVEVHTVQSLGNPTIREAYASFSEAATSSGRLEILESMAGMAFEQEPELLGLLEKALDDPDPEVVRSAAQMLEPYRSAQVLPLAEKALRSRDEEVRYCALAPLEEIEDPKCAELVVLALSDPSETVRGRALDVIRGQAPDIQILSLRRAFGSGSDEVKSELLSLLELRGDKAAVEVILNGLNDPNPEFREEVKGVLQVLLDQEFKNYNQAMRWWKANEHRYDEHLFEQ